MLYRIYFIMNEQPRIYPLFGDGRYRVWAHGQVDGLRSGEWRTLRPCISRYANFNLCHKGVFRTASMHRMVATCFIPNPLGLSDVNHKDFNKHNSHVDNLEWCSRKENMHHYFAARAARKRS